MAAPVGICLYGSGNATRVQLEAYRHVVGARVLSIAARNRSKAEMLARAFDVPNVYTNVEDALDGPGVVALDIASALETHTRLGLAAARAGKHVLCQKPLAASLREARELLDACTTAGVRLMVNENWRWRAWYRTVAAVIRSGNIGAVRRFSLEQREPESLFDVAQHLACARLGQADRLGGTVQLPEFAELAQEHQVLEPEPIHQ